MPIKLNFRTQPYNFTLGVIMELVEILDRSRLRGFHYILLATCSLVYMLTALNVMIIGAVVNPIAREFMLDTASISILLSMGFIGMFIGAISFGRIADIIGRRRTLMIVLFIEAIFTALHGLAIDIYTLYFLRLIAGIGTGAALPQPGIYISEYVPKDYRGRFLGIVETSWVYGALLSLLFPYLIIPLYGWRVSFIAGLLPLTLIPLIGLYFPESIRYLVRVGRYDEVKSILYGKGFIPAGEEVSIHAIEAERRRVSDLFSPRYASRTILLAILWMALVYTYYAVFLWLPRFYAKTFGMGDVLSLYWVIIITLFQIPGYYSATFLLDRVGRKKVLAFYLIVAGVASWILGIYIDESWFLAWSIVISFFNLGAWAGLYTYTPELFPTDIRGLGSGFSASMGRVAGILSPLFTGLLYSLYGLQGPYIATSLIHIIGGLAVIFLGIETMGRSLEELE